MTVLAYQVSSFLPGTINGYQVFTGQVDLEFSDTAEIDIGQLVYDEHATLTPPTDPNWGYVYLWKAYLFQAPTTANNVTSFASEPPRYKFGHLTTASVSGIVWNDVLTFEDQITPIFRGSFYKDNPNPGDGFPFGTVPLGESIITTWREEGGQGNVVRLSQAKATFLNPFLFRPSDYIVRVTYTAYLSWTTVSIAAVAPLNFVVVYP